MATTVIRDVLHAYDFTPSDRPSDPAGEDPESPVLVFIHGWLLSRAYWQPLIDLLKQDYACLAYDLRGFGESAAKTQGDRYPDQGYTLQDYGTDLQHLLETLNLKHVWLVGHSLGGSIALWGAAICPKRVRGIICINAGGGIYLKEDFEKFRNAGQNLVKNRWPFLKHIPLLDLFFARLMVHRPLSRQWGKQRIHDFLQADATAALGALLETTTEQEVHYLPQLVAQLVQPVYFLAGQQDPVMELKYVRHLASFHPSFGCMGNNVREIDHCGHLAMVEQTIAVAENIREILNQDHP
ncbi:esterase [Picosynechococcus sp. PCC 7003]|uniref:alpha/beta fold hydrolase n=1 Tax=Picosynechococcus sp. PCC 7003 TaxID=374981 RepID=UPI00081084CE|nr:alpha/beta hydrolase [Picosynechococcus sp. PCC 7003]ANV84381.1 esterase [Picosynechococcus sp. PCC 7003]